MPAPDPPLLRLTLRDGRPVALRPIEPADRDRLRAGFDALSEDSKRLRFLGATSALSDRTLRYFTEVDGHDHVAWVALDLDYPEAPGFGVGRFVRFEAEPEVAEFSLTVVDSAQGHGVGQLLLAVLVALAPAADVAVLRGVVGRENETMTRWLRRLGATAADDGQDLLMDLALPIDPDASPSAADFCETVATVRAALDAWHGGGDEPSPSPAG